MQNDYTNKQGQSASDKASEFARTAGQQFEQKSKEMAEDAQKMLQQGKEQASKAFQTIDKQVRDNPWPFIAGVGAGAFLIGCIVGRSK